MDDRTKFHSPEYLMVGAELGAFMISACAFGVLLEHPTSPVRALIPSGELRRAIMGVAMGLTAIAIVYSPLGTLGGSLQSVRDLDLLATRQGGAGRRALLHGRALR
jgi:hypothetical protein